MKESRWWGWLMELGALTDPARPWTRSAFTELHRQGREFLAARMRDVGLEVRMDGAGNLIGRREGIGDAGTLMIGSHSDTVVGGGRFDGIAGVIAGLEVAARLGERGVGLRHSLEIVDFLAEEPNEFGLSCVGSRGMVGALDDAMLARPNRAGVTLGRAIAEYAGEGGRSREDIAAFFELHIEQGPVLEANGRDVGIVTHIAGIRRLELVFKGQAAHAGTTPLVLRKDALVAASHFVVGLREELERVEGFVIATVGEIHVRPNAPNVVPGEARLVVDLRSDDGKALVEWTERITGMASGAQLRLLSATGPTTCSPFLAGYLRQAAENLGVSQQDIVSGAGHDAAFLAKVAPVAMVFVPSQRGMSHCAQEWTEPAELGKGIATLVEAVKLFDRGKES